MTRLELFLLGIPRISHNGQSVTIPERKAMALLIYLALGRERFRRDTLATLFWPECNQRQARANLRGTLWLLKKILGAGWLEADRETIGLRQAAEVYTDVTEFHVLVAKGQGQAALERAGIACLREAAALYQGDFLTGFTLTDSPAFDEWQFDQSEQLRRILAIAVERLVCHYGDESELETAIAYARRWLALDRLQEPVHRHLMHLLARSGQHAAALRQYTECVRLLDEELGVAPEEGTTALYEQIRDRRISSSSERLSASPAAAPQHNLPLQPTRFVGRKVELRHIRQLLDDPDCRLLTVLGPGGIGKTRLALQAAADQVHAFAHGVWFVPLASLGAAGLLASTILDVLDVTYTGAAKTEIVLCDHLRDKQLLLILDNFEHLSEGVGLLAEMLRQAPGIKLLVTSRERVNLREEWLFPLAGMRVPAEPNLDPAEPAPAAEHDAIKLFGQSAHQLSPDFLLHATNFPAIIRICQLVEGMPLAIELAAGWLHVMPPDAIAAEIERGLDALVTSLHNMPERHRSMQVVFTHSWQLLSVHQRQCLCRLSVFQGGWTREAAQAVAGASLADLAILANKSWLHMAPSGRYDMHGLVRQYAVERLMGEYAQISDETAADVRNRHSAYYAAYLHQRKDDLKGRRQNAALAQVLAEIDNAWAAWRWAVNLTQIAWLEQCVESLALVADACGSYQAVGHAFDAAASKLKAYVDAVDPNDNPRQTRKAQRVLAHILMRQGWIAIDLGALAQAETLCQQSRTLLHHAAQGGHEALYATATLHLGWVLYNQGHYAQAEPLYHEALAGFEAVGDQWGRGKAFCFLAVSAARQGRLEEAEQWVQASLVIWEELGVLIETICARRIWGTIACAQGEYQRAQTLLLDALKLARALDDKRQVCHTLLYLGEAAMAQARVAEAKEYYTEGLMRAQTKTSGDRLAEVGFRNGLAATCLALGEQARTKEIYQNNFTICQQIGRHRDSVVALLGLGNVADVQGKYQQARQHFLQALQTALAIQAVPEVLSAVVSLAGLLIKQADEQQAGKLLRIVLQHPAGTRQTKDSAGRLLSSLNSPLLSRPVLAAGTIQPLRVEQWLADVLRELAPR